MQLTEKERDLLVDELADAMYGSVTFDGGYAVSRPELVRGAAQCLPIIDRLLADHAVPEPDADAVDGELREILATLLRAGPEFIDDAVANIRLVAEQAAAVEPEPGLDELLDSVHPECGIRDLTVLPGIPASAVIIYPTEYDAKGRWAEYETYGGTGATGMEALANAVKSAKEAKP